jgi:predicted nucleic acid-binding protein
VKVVYDTCLYIDLLRSGKREDLFLNRTHFRFLSPIVLMELRAGARTRKQQKVVDRLLLPYSKAQRIIQIHTNLYYKAGELIAAMNLEKRELKGGLIHDILIALSAHSIGATCLTANKKDFERIARRVPVKMSYV